LSLVEGISFEGSKQHLPEWIEQRLILSDSTATGNRNANGFPQLSRLNPLVMRLPLWNPDRFLTATLPFVRPLMSPLAMLFSLVLMIWALLYAASEFRQIGWQLTLLPQLFEARHWLLVLAILSIARMVHEFGHAYVCKRFGGSCTELGVMFLAFIPCLYCNVTDSWTFPRRQRILVSGAGIAVDLLIAAGALLVWSITTPGLLQSICLLLAVTGSINSLFLNGNPLMRYDGYFVLSDLTGVANLRSESMTESRRLLWRFLFGPPQPEHDRPFHAGLACYGLAATIYVWAIVLLILYGIYAFAAPLQLESLAFLVATFVVPGMVISSGQILQREGQIERRQREPPPLRFGIGLLAFALIVGVLLLFPFPRRISGTGVTRFADKQDLVVPAEGQLAEITQSGLSINADETAVRLTNPELDQRLQALETERRTLNARRVAIERKLTQLNDGRVALAVTQEMIAALDRQLLELRQRRDQIQITAERDGFLVGAEFEPVQQQETITAPENWLSPLNLGRQVARGTRMGSIRHSDEVELVVRIPDYWSKYVTRGQDVRIYVPELCGAPATGNVIELSEASQIDEPMQPPEYRLLDRELSSRIISDPAQSNELFAIIRLDKAPEYPLSAQQICPVRIRIAPASLATRIIQFTQRAFRLEV